MSSLAWLPRHGVPTVISAHRLVPAGESLRRNMTKLTRHSLPPGRLKMAEQASWRISSTQAAAATGMLWRQCFSIIVVLITLISVRADVEMTTTTRISSDVTAVAGTVNEQLSLTDSGPNDKPPTMATIGTTAATGMRILEMTTFGSPETAAAVEASLVPVVVVEEKTTTATLMERRVKGSVTKQESDGMGDVKNYHEMLRLSGTEMENVGEGVEAVVTRGADTISTTLEAFTMTTSTTTRGSGGVANGQAMSLMTETGAAAAAASAPTTRTTRMAVSGIVGSSSSTGGESVPYEAELSPQNDQPGRLGEEEDVLLSDDDGLDSSSSRASVGVIGDRGYYYSGNDNMEKLGAGASGGGGDVGGGASEHHHKPLRDSGTGELSVASSSRGGNINNDNGKGFNDMDIQCPSFTENSACPCYKFDDGLFLECPGTTAFSLRTTLQLITAPIQSLSVYDFDRSVTTLTQDVFSAKLHIRHLQFSQSHLELVADNALRTVSNSLESLSIVNGKLTRIPQKAIWGMDRLTMIDFESNEIREVGAESFDGLHLTKLNLKSNRIETIQANAFKGVEMTLSEIDLSDNKLRAFPLVVLRQLDNLRSLRLALNEMSTLLWDGHTKLPALQFLDLSSNQFTELGEHFFHPFPKLKTLSLYSNALRVVHRNALHYLKELVSVDISHNNLITLDRNVFENNKKLQTIDLSHNHLHYVDDMFTNLPFLREVFLSENNILELSRDVFTNSSRITVVYLEHNAIRRLDGHLLATLAHLQQLYLSNSFIATVAEEFLRPATELTSLSLDGNWLVAVERGLFQTLTQLRELRLHGNQIRQIQRNIFQPLPALIELHLQHNLISAIEADAFASLTSLLHLNLQHNRLHRLEAILPAAPNSAVTSVQLDGNRLTTVNDGVWRGQRHLQILWLSNNQLTTLSRDLFSDLVGVERLYLLNNSVEKIHGDTFKAMTSLKLIDLSGNSLTEIKRNHFSPHLVDLEELVLRANRIQTIETRAFDKLSKLRTLDLSENFISKLTKDMFQDELQINTISLQRSKVAHIETGTFRSMNNLYELNLEENQLTAEDVRQLDVPSLRMLRLSHNVQLNDSTQLVAATNSRFYSAPAAVRLDGMFDKLPSLQILRLTNCNIHELPEMIFTRNTNLVRIELSYNQLRALPRNMFHGLNVLKELRLTGNLLSEFPHHALLSISGLETLSMSHNQLTSIDFSKLNGLPSIRHLDLGDNLISSMSGFSAVNVTQLDFVDLSGNYLLALPSNFFYNSINLHRVDLSRNRFQHIPSNALGDSSLPRLSWLNVSGNPLNVFYDGQSQQAPAKFSFLKELHIRHTNLTIVTSQDFQAFPALQQLVMTHNRINRISPGAFNGLRSLLTLDVSVNELEKVPKERMQGLRLLRHLNMSHNVLRELDEFPEDLNQLRQLDLSYNQLTKLGKATLRNLINLFELHLVGNRLKTVAGEAFRNVHQLQWLDLRKNYFEHIPLTAIQVVEAHLKTLKIEDNPIQCSCDTQELWEWLRNHLKLILSPMNRNSDGDLSSGSASGSGSGIGSASNMGGHTTSGKQKQGNHWIRPDEDEFAVRQRLLADGGGSELPASSTLLLPDELLGDEGFVVTGPGSSADGSDAEFLTSHLRCDQPTGLRGRILMNMEPHLFCDAPLILKVAIQDIQPYTVLVSWQTREHSGLHGYHVVYRSMEADSNEVRSVTLDRWATSAKLFKLAPGTQYQICVVGIGTWAHNSPIASDVVKSLSSTSYYFSPGTASTSSGSARFNARHPEQNALEALLRNNVTSKCQEVVTLDAELSLMMDEHGLATAGSTTSFIQSLLTRRLGLIVGCALGIIVFIVLISVLGWLKIKKQRVLEETKRMQPMPPDFISYRHFSIPNEEHNRILQTGVDIGQNIHPHNHNHGGGGGGGRAVYISRNEFSAPLMMTSTANGTDDGGGCATGNGPVMQSS